MTGVELEGIPTTIEPRQAELIALHQEVFGKRQAPPKNAGPSPPMEMSDSALIDKAKSATNEQKFSALWDGDTSEYGGDDSRADLALCRKLAFYAGPDPGRIDRLFRQSGLMREKWERQDYRDRTITKALAGITEFYTPGHAKGKRYKKGTTPDIGGEVPKHQADLDKHIERLNRSHAVAQISGKTVILNEIQDHKGRPDITFSSVNDFKNFQENQRVWMNTAQGPRSVAAAPEWMKSPARRQYPRGVVFSPGKEPPGAYNLWRGFAVAPAPGDWSLFRAHMLQNICSGNELHFNYLLDWMARNVQDPGGERPGVAVVLKSVDFGTGKGVFTTQYGTLFGPHFRHITNGMQLLGKFNNHLKDCLLCFVDEGVWGGDKQAAGVLKGLITERIMMIEPKGINAFPVENHINLIIASNNDWVVPAGFDERRYLVLDVSPKRKQDTEYFGEIVAQMDRGGQAAMLHDLLERKITIDLRKVPKTAALFDQVVNSMTIVQKFWYDRLRRAESREWPPYVLKKYLFEDYRDFARACGDRYPLIDQQLGKELRLLCPNIRSGRVKTSQSRYRVYFLPNLDICRANFEKAVGLKVDWDTDEELDENED